MYDVSKNTPLSIYKEVSQPATAQVESINLENVAADLQDFFQSNGKEAEQITAAEGDQINLDDSGMIAQYHPKTETFSIEDWGNNGKLIASAVEPDQLALVAYAILHRRQAFEVATGRITPIAYDMLETLTAS